MKTFKKSPPDLETYHIPNAHPDEFLIEKSPQYARGTRESLRNNAIRMLEANPKMKLFAFISGLLKVKSNASQKDIKLTQLLRTF